MNESFIRKIESVRYKAAFAITGAIKGTSKQRLYEGLGLKSLEKRRWYENLLISKVMNNLAPL